MQTDKRHATPMIKTVIFDFDGTLTELTLDFEHLRKEIVNIALKYTNTETLGILDGFYIIEMIYELEKMLGSKGKKFSKEAFKRLEELELGAAEGKGVFPYTRDVLKGLRDRGIKTGIITRSCLAVLNSVFPDISDYTDGLATREHSRYVKPDPLHVHYALRLLQTKPKDAMLVGDHPTDVIAGNNAGLTTVGVLSGRTKKENFEEAGADYIVADIRDILNIISN